MLGERYTLHFRGNSSKFVKAYGYYSIKYFLKAILNFFVYRQNMCSLWNTKQ